MTAATPARALSGAIVLVDATPGIYRIIDRKTDRFYIGSSVNMRKRWGQHLGRLRAGTHPNPILQAIWNADQARLTIEQLRTCPRDRAALLQAEQRELDASDVGNNRMCMNVLPVAGSHLGRKRSDATRAAMANAQRGRTASPETRAKQRAAKLGRPQTLEVRRAQSERQRGKKLSKPRQKTPALWARSLTDEQVRHLRLRRAEGLSWRLLGIEFNLHPSAAKRCALGFSYRDIV